jgi:hypothetical protein
MQGTVAIGIGVLPHRGLRNDCLRVLVLWSRAVHGPSGASTERHADRLVIPRVRIAPAGACRAWVAPCAERCEMA